MLQAKEEKEERRREREEELARASRYQQVLAAQVHEVQTGRANDPASHVMTAIEASLNRPLLVSMRERKAVKTNHPPPTTPKVGPERRQTGFNSARGCLRLPQAPAQHQPRVPRGRPYLHIRLVFDTGAQVRGLQLHARMIS